MNKWLMVTTQESYEATARAGLLGFYGNQAGSNLIAKTSPGDQVIFYISKRRVLKGLFVVDSEPFLDESKLYGDARDREWNQRVRVRALDAQAETPIESLAPNLEFTNRSKNYGLYLLKTLVSLPESDFKLMTAALGVGAARS